MDDRSVDGVLVHTECMTHRSRTVEQDHPTIREVLCRLNTVIAHSVIIAAIAEAVGAKDRRPATAMAS